MSLLRDIQDNGRHPIHGWTMLGAVLVWPLIGGVVAYWSASLVSLSASALTVAAAVGMLIGFCVGFYAAFSRTTLALILSLPGIIAVFWN